MALDRWIALIIMMIGLSYGYAAFFAMDGSLPPFMQRNPIWPSTFPKVLSVLVVLCSLAIVLGLEKSESEPKPSEIDYRRLLDYNLGQALGLLALMVAYALLLRPIGFLLATVGFLVAGSLVLGERNYPALGLVACVAAGVVWYLVNVVLGIYLAPLPAFLASGG